MRSYIIHMTGDTRRQDNAETLRATLPNAEIVAAVNGREAVASKAHPVRPGLAHSPRYPFPLGPGEVGCFLSHRACWQRIVDSGADHALIAEDDLSIDPAIWPDVLALIDAQMTPDRFIRLPAKARERPIHIFARQGRAVLFLPRVIGLQTVCQVVGRVAAGRLLAASAVIDRPVDTFLQMHWVTRQPVLTLHPNGVRELTDALGGSTIQQSGEDSKARREVNRAWYRARIAMRPQPRRQTGALVVRR